MSVHRNFTHFKDTNISFSQNRNYQTWSSINLEGFTNHCLETLVFHSEEKKKKKSSFTPLCVQSQRKSVFHHTTYLVDLCVINFKNYWGPTMFTQEQALKNEGFVSCVRDAVAGRKGWPLCLRHKRRWEARELAFTPHSARAALWYSSYDWNKILKFATEPGYIFFSEKWMAAILAYLIAVVSNSVMFERQTTKSLTLHLRRKKYRGFEDPRTCIAKEEINFLNF